MTVNAQGHSHNTPPITCSSRANAHRQKLNKVLDAFEDSCGRGVTLDELGAIKGKEDQAGDPHLIQRP
jgi:hypothetical protein